VDQSTDPARGCPGDCARICYDLASAALSAGKLLILKTDSLGPPLLVIPYTTILAFAALYLPQPFLPLLAAEYGVEDTDAALLMAVTMVPLGIAPIAYGYFVERVTAKRLLTTAVGLLMASEFLLALAGSFWLLVVLRFVQGLILPAVITSLMTYSASVASSGRVRNALNIYIGTSILGGVSGRLLGGFLAEFVHWRAAFEVTAVLLAIAWGGLRKLSGDAQASTSPIGVSAISRALGNPVYRNAYLAIFFVFFVFASLLTYLPFRLKSLDPTIGESVISLMYLGYLIGVAIALNGVRIADCIGGELRVVFGGIGVLACGLLGIAGESLPVVFAFVFCLCGGFFLIHSSLTAFLAHVTPSGRGVVNGLYISSYYAGGAFGAWLPGYVYRAGGWSAYLTVLGVTLAIAAWWSRRLLAAHAAQAQR